VVSTTEIIQHKLCKHFSTLIIAGVPVFNGNRRLYAEQNSIVITHQ